MVLICVRACLHLPFSCFSEIDNNGSINKYLTFLSPRSHRRRCHRIPKKLYDPWLMIAICDNTIQNHLIVLFYLRWRKTANDICCSITIHRIFLSSDWGEIFKLFQINDNKNTPLLYFIYLVVIYLFFHKKIIWSGKTRLDVHNFIST